MPHITCKKNLVQRIFLIFDMFLLLKFSINLPKNNGVFRVTFLGTELRVIGYVFCFFVNEIGNVPWQQ